MQLLKSRNNVLKQKTPCIMLFFDRLWNQILYYGWRESLGLVGAHSKM